MSRDIPDLGRGRDEQFIDTARESARLEQKMTERINETIQAPEATEELKIFASVIAKAGDGRLAIVFSLPSGRQIAAPMMERQWDRIAREIQAAKAPSENGQ